MIVEKDWYAPDEGYCSDVMYVAARELVLEYLLAENPEYPPSKKVLDVYKKIPNPTTSLELFHETVNGLVFTSIERRLTDEWYEIADLLMVPNNSLDIHRLGLAQLEPIQMRIVNLAFRLLSVGQEIPASPSVLKARKEWSAERLQKYISKNYRKKRIVKRLGSRRTMGLFGRSFVKR